MILSNREFIGFENNGEKPLTITLNTDLKKIINLPLEWQKTEEKIKISKNVQCILTGEKNDIMVLDFDLQSSFIAFTQKYEFLLNTFTVKTKRGYHLYFKYNSKLPSGADMMNNFSKIDIISDGKFIISPLSSYIDEKGKKIIYEIKNDMEIKELNDDEINLIYDEIKDSKKGINKLEVKTINNNDVPNNISLIADLISMDFIDNYDDYIRLVWAFSNCDLYDLSIKILSKSSKFDKAHHDKIYFNDKRQVLGIGSIMHYAKLSNFEEYIKLKPKLTKLLNNDDSLSNLFLDFERDNIIFKDEKIYIYTVNKWVLDDGYTVKKIIRDTLNKYVSYRIKLQQDIILQADEEDRKAYIKYAEELNKIQLRLTVKKSIDNILEFTKQSLSFEGKSKDIEFDTGKDQIYNLHFKNGVYELKKKLFRPRLKSDYITKYLDWNFEPERDEHKIEEIRSDFKKIQPDENQLKFLLGWLAYSLDGDNGRQKMKFNIGYTAQNGKSTEFKIHKMIFDIYTMKLDNRTFDSNYSKMHKQFIHLINNPIRLAYIEELSRNNLNVDLLKDFVDGDSLNVEIMYGTSTTKNIQCILSTCSNKDFNMKEADAGIMRRGLVQYYNSKFIKNVEDDSIKHIYKRVDRFEEKYIDEGYKNAYFHLLLEYYDNDDFIPHENENNFKDIVEQYDTFKMACENVFEITGDDYDRVGKIQALDAFNSMSGLHKMSWSKFLSEMKRIEVEYDRTKRDKDSNKGVFLGIKIIDIDDDEIDELDNIIN